MKELVTLRAVNFLRAAWVLIQFWTGARSIISLS